MYFRSQQFFNNRTISKGPFTPILPNNVESTQNRGPRRLISLQYQKESAKRLSTLIIRPNSGKIIYGEADRSKYQSQPRPATPTAIWGVYNSALNQRNPLSNLVQFSASSKENQNSSLENESQKQMKLAFLKKLQSSQQSIGKISPAYHPGGSLRNRNSSFGSRLETVMEQTKGFPYLFPHTGNTHETD